MKSPREILFGRYRRVEPELDAVRAEVLKSEFGRHGRSAAGAETFAMLLRAFVRDFRRQLAAMGAVWLFIALLHLSVGHPTNLAAATPKDEIPSPQIILTSLRENRRQLAELLGLCDAEPRRAILPGPRSEWHDETMTA